jgi:DNA-binding transcriptional ArsR family regulator
MSIASTHDSAAESRNEAQLDRVFHALADRTRRALIKRLRDGPLKITDLAEPFEMSLPAVSKHLRVLENAQLVSRTIDGRIHQCALAPGPLASADQWLDGYRTHWEETLDALARYVEKPKPRKKAARRRRS